MFHTGKSLLHWRPLVCSVFKQGSWIIPFSKPEFKEIKYFTKLSHISALATRWSDSLRPLYGQWSARANYPWEWPLRSLQTIIMTHNGTLMTNGPSWVRSRPRNSDHGCNTLQVPVKIIYTWTFEVSWSMLKGDD